jgi:hypothetical protein
MRPSSPLRWVKRSIPALWSLALAPCALLLALLFVPGCSDTPMSPGQPVESMDDSSLQALGQAAGGPQWTVIKLILSRGGLMKLDGERVTCSFAPGALPLSQVLIIANMKLNGARGEATRLDVDFQPSLLFNRPVTLKVDSDYLAGTGNKYILWYFDPAQETWLIEGESTILGGLPALFNLKHFSAYAITRRGPSEPDLSR